MLAAPPDRRLIALVCLTLAGCWGDSGTNPPDPPDPPEEPVVATVIVTSPIDTLLASGWSTTFQATARDADGGSVTTAFSWTSTSVDVATVDGAGVVTAGQPGTATIRATTDDVTGELRVRVLDADVPHAAGVISDPLLAHLIAPLGGAAAPVASAVEACEEALVAGNLVAASVAIGQIRAAAEGATDPDARALLAVAQLLSDHASRLLDL